MVSAQNEFRNEFRRRFHISVDDNEVSRGDNNTLLQRVCAQVSSFPSESLYNGTWENKSYCLPSFLKAHLHLWCFKQQLTTSV